MTEELETKTTDVQEDNGKLFNSKSLMSTSSQAVLLSWLFLAVIVLFVVNLIVFLLSVAGVQFQGAIVTMNQMVGNLSTPLLLIAIAGFFFVFLRAISEGLYLLMDLGDEVSKIGKAVEKKQKKKLRRKFDPHSRTLIVCPGCHLVCWGRLFL